MIEDFFKVVELSAAFQRISRVVEVPGTNRQETDAEHSFQLALVAWYLIERDGLPLDRQKVIGCALAHDLVEVYAGDTYLYDEAGHQDKDQREADAAKRLAEEFPEFPEMALFIDEYKHRATPEARFVYALDKLLPMVNNHLAGGKLWRKKGVTYGMLRENKDAKIALSPEVDAYYQELLALFAGHEDELFAR